jgi:DNA-binding transcriptional LysR family regulator
MHISWEYIETFLAVAEETSFSAAARKLEVTQPTISRRIVALEEKLGRSLFRRDVEGAHLNADGAKLLPLAAQMARYAEEFFVLAEHFEEQVEGMARLAAPVPVTHTFIIPFARWATAQFPELTIQVQQRASEDMLASGQIELGLLEQAPSHPELSVLARGKFATALYAAEAYAKECSRDPERIELIGFPASMSQRQPNATLRRKRPNHKMAFSSPDPSLQWSAMEAGLGAMLLPELFFGAPLAKRMDAGIEFPKMELFLVSSPGALLLPRVRALAEALKERFQTAVSKE